MKRKIIKIDEEKCNGCGLCVTACHEGAIQLNCGKARLIRDDYCDGLGDCLPVCPTGAITFEEREALAYDEAAVLQNQAKAKKTFTVAAEKAPLACGCPGTASKSLKPSAPSSLPNQQSTAQNSQVNSELMQWPVQLKLVPTNASWLNGAHLLVAADCAAYAYANFHQDFIRNKVTVIGCPKLDTGDYTEKLTEILAQNNIQSLTIVRMEVPCCGGLSHAATEALKASGKFIPWSLVTISTDGNIL